MQRLNPLDKEELQKYDLIAYTDGAYQRKKNEKMGAAAYVVYNNHYELIAS